MIALAAIALALAGPPDTTAVTVDRFEDLAPWSAHPAEGVTMHLRPDSGHDGRAMRLDFDFVKGGGYAVAHRALALDLPDNYAFAFWIKGDAPRNTLEFKLIDSSGDNVWWFRDVNRVFDGKWHHLVIRKRQIDFAWGPRGGGTLHHVAALELVITAGLGGGSGSVWFDDLTLTPKPVLGPYVGEPVVSASGAVAGYPPAAVTGDSGSSWRAPPGRATLTLDFGRLREYGGLSIQWERARRARNYDVAVSDDGDAWTVIRRVTDGFGARDDLFLPNTESRYLRLTLTAGGDSGYGMRQVSVQPLSFGASRNAFFETVARRAPRGMYPRAFTGERSDWTVVGVSGGRGRGLIDEDGAVDAGPGAFSVEPFLRETPHGTLISWHDVTHRVSLADGVLPIPSVEWTTDDLRLVVTAFATGPAADPSLVVRYRVINRGGRTLRPSLYLAVRPFQVNPPWQFLGIPGGVARVDSLRWDGHELRVNDDRLLVPLTPPAGVFASTFEHGDVVERLRADEPTRTVASADSAGAASAVLTYPLTLAPGDARDVTLEIPLVRRAEPALAPGHAGAVDAALAAVERDWRAALEGVTIDLPPSGRPLEDAMRTSVAWLLVNRDGPAIQPGARAYARSWIRDGAVISDALLRFGHPEPVRDFLEWYAPFQYANGMIPCCVDSRGADPVPEDDSNGEFIYAVMDYWRHTADTAFLAKLWPHVERAVAYLDSLRRLDRTDAYRSGPARAFYGLLPPSISHEGYSAKPMHSYWDDFWAIRGLDDATAMARVLGHGDAVARFAAIRDQFRDDVLRSIPFAMRQHQIDYIPGAADLGDFDPTSTTIALDPVGVRERLPREALTNTFERYWREAESRMHDTTWTDYAGYEVRAVGAMLRLGWPGRALALMRAFLAAREPPAWNQWPEVIRRARRAPQFLGDLPHTWVAADFLRAATSLFAYDRYADSALVIAAGLDSTWLGGTGVRVHRLGTAWGPLSYAARREGSRVAVHLSDGVTIPPGGVVVATPLHRPARRVTVGGRPVTPDASGAVLVRRLPADIVFDY